ncbi:hypothetical protein ACNZ9Q_000353 [Escherichia coli]
MLLPDQPANGHCVLKSRLLIQRQRQICAVKELVKQRNRIIRNGGDYALEHHNFALSVNSLEDWKENLKRKSEKELEEWIINRQRQSAALTDLMDQYVLLAYRTTVDDSRN